MKSIETVSTQANDQITMTQRQHRAGGYRKVFDGRKRRIRGLWERNGSYYAQITIPDETTGQKAVRRVRCEDKDGNPVTTAAEARDAMNGMKAKRADEGLKLAPKRTPTFGEYADGYLKHFEAMPDAKRPQTLKRERTAINSLKEHMAALRLREITKASVNGYMAKRQAAGVSGRSCNIELVVLRNVLRKAIDDGYLHALAIDGVKWLNDDAETKRLITHEEIDRICSTALELAPITGQSFADFIRLMAYSGGRWSETLRLRWSDVNMTTKQLTFGADGLSKNGEKRAVDFNAKLEAHLKEMATRRWPKTPFLFPSRRGDGEKAAITFNKTLRAVRTKAKIPDFTCHLCRHFFASMCLMSKVDVATVAEWLGHQDKGVLLAKTYSHLLGEHKRTQALNVNFGVVVMDKAQNQ